MACGGYCQCIHQVENDEGHVAEISYVDCRALPELFSFMDSCLVIKLCKGEREIEAEVSHVSILVMSLLKLNFTNGSSCFFLLSGIMISDSALSFIMYEN